MTKEDKIICDVCKFPFKAKNVELKEEKIVIEAQPMTMVYFECPFCKKRYIVLFKDCTYELLAADLEQEKLKYNNYLILGDKYIAEGQYEIVKKKSNKLAAHIDFLNNRYKNNFTS